MRRGFPSILFPGERPLMESETQILYISSRAREDSLALFNWNAYPRSERRLVDTCGLRLATLLHEANLTERQQAEDRNAFAKRLNDVRPELLRGELGRPELNQVAYFDSVELYSLFNGTLRTLKALLDSFAHLVGRLIMPTGSFPGFNKGRVSGRELSGGRLINWLRNHGDTERDHSLLLADLFEAESERWISYAVDLRDSFTHHEGSPRVACHRIRIRTLGGQFDVATSIEAPQIEGVAIGLYARGCAADARRLVCETLKLTPGIDRSLLRMP
jgi:hypothetical protein